MKKNKNKCPINIDGGMGMKKIKPTFKEDSSFGPNMDGGFIKPLASTRIPANDSLPFGSEAEFLSQNPFSKSKTEHNKMLIRRRKRSQHPLRDLRLKRGFTLEELAELTSLSPSYLSRLESGSRRLNADILQRIATILACHPGDLLPTDAFTYKYPQNHLSSESESLGTSHPVYIKDLPFQVFLCEDDQEDRFRITLDHDIEWVTRPPQLYGITGAFAFKVTTACCHNRYQSHDFVFADPSRAFTSDCYILAVNHVGYAYVGQFKCWMSSDDSGIVDTLVMSVANFGQAVKEIRIKKSEIKVSYRIVGTSEAS